MSLLKPYSPLVFPGNRLPGFDPSHVATPGGVLSVIATGSNFINLLRGNAGTVTGSPTSVMDGRTGPTSFYNAVSTYSLFTGLPAVTPTLSTQAAILTPTSFGTSRILFSSTGGTTAGIGIFLSTTGQIQLLRWNNFYATIGQLVVNTPYFIAVSTNFTSNVYNVVVVNLSNGAVNTYSGTPSLSGPTADNGNFYIGAYPPSPTTYAAFIKFAAIYYSQTLFLSVPQLLAWAADPWSFWYPATQRDLLFRGLSVAAGGGTAYTISSAEGTYTLTGKAQTLNTSRSISSVQGVYNLTGKPQSSVHTQQMSLAQGSYSLVGEPQTLNKSLTVSLAQGSYTQTGQATTPQVGMPATQGSYSLTGKATSFSTALSIRPVQGSYILTGFPQVLTKTSSGSSGQVSGNKFIADVGQMTEKTY